MGTSHYMSPEQARAKPVDARSDIWSLGVVIYEMVAGRTPFEGETATDVIVAITQKEPLPLIRFAPTVPAELDWIVTKALRKDREERYQTIKELLTDLRRLKQRIEFEAELERSVAPESFTRSAISAVVSAPTIQEKATPTVEKTVSHVSSAEYIATGIQRHKIAAILIALILIAGVSLGAYFYTHRKPTFTDKDTILLTDFVNTTGEPVFDGTLKQALSVQLGQTPFLNIYPEERVRETLRFMGKSPEDRITRDIGREICERQGIKALLTGSIASLGSHYIITLEAINAHTGDPIAREQIEAEQKEKVLSSLGTAAMNLRQKLGESLNSIKKYDVAIEQATTSSLEALKAFSMGNEERNKGRTREALNHYKRAIELDPNFAMAYARIAVYYGNQDQIESAKEYVEKAFALRERVSEREKLYIMEKYYSYMTGEFDKRADVLQTWASQYPNDYIPHNNLALSYLTLGRFEEGQKEAQLAIELSPANLSARTNLIGSFFGQDRFDEAEQAINELARINPESGSTYFDRYSIAFIRGDKAGMDAQTNAVKGKASEVDFLTTLAAVSAYYGKLKEAEGLIQRAREGFKSQGRIENEAQATVFLALRQASLGKCQQAKQNTAAGLALIRGRISLSAAGEVAAICNDVTLAQSIMDEIQKAYPQDTFAVSLLVPAMKAELELNRGNGAAAVQLLEPTRRFDFGFAGGVGNIFLRGLAYLQQGMTAEAVSEFQKILARRGVDMLTTVRPLTRLYLARAYVKLGDTAKARKEYQDLLALWKDADPDLQPLIEAKKEYEQLK